MSRTINITQNGITRTINVATGVGPQGPQGESGVSNWDDIEGRPPTFTPTAHKASHATGGADALTPGDIGAEVSGAAAAAQAFAIQRANHTGTQAISTVTNLQTTLNAKQSDGKGFLERFGRFANGASVANGSTPEIGGNALIIWGSGSANPTIVNRALEAASGTLIYYGQTVSNTSARFSLLLMAEVRINASYTSGSTDPDLTLGVNGKPFGDLGTFLNTPQALHAQIRPTGQANGEFYTESPSPPADDGLTAFPTPPVGRKFPILVVVERSECRISMLGQTRVYRDSRYFDRITNVAQTGFFVEWGAPDSSTKYYWAIHSIAANCPTYEQELMFFGGSAGDQGARLTSRGPAVIQGTLRANEDNGNSSYLANQTPQVTDSFAFPGRGMLGYSSYFRPFNAVTAQIAGNIDRGTSILSSNASASNQALVVLAHLENLLLVNGDQLKYCYYGRFAANANTKRIRLGRDPTVIHFDSGDLTENNTPYRIESLVYRVGGALRHHTVMTYGAGLTIIQAGTFDGVAAQRFYVTGTAAGDITLDYRTTDLMKLP